MPGADGAPGAGRLAGVELGPLAPWPVRPADGADAETVDVGELARTVARGWRTVALGGLAGLLVAALLITFFPPRYRATASVLLRNANDPTGSLLSRFGIGGDVAASAGGGLGGVLKSPLETEVQLLGSRDVLGQVSDSLGLQARVRAPRGLPSSALLEPTRYPGTFRAVNVRFARRPDGSYAAHTEGADVVVRPGAAVVVPAVGRVTLARGPLPPAFDVRFEDREDAINRLADRMSIDKRGGEVASVDYSGPDSLTAAAVANAVIAVYLERRRTVDRGLNQRRFEFLRAEADSIAQRLGGAEQSLRTEQERSGMFDPELAGKAAVEALQAVRVQAGELEAERQSAHTVVADVERGAIRPRQLVAFPTFLKSPAINSVLSQINQLETERTRLLERRTERDPEVAVLTASVAELERQLLPLARTYSTSLDRQTGDLARQAANIERQMAALPAQAEGNLRQQREVKRLSQTELGLQAQLIETRLAAISEGGQVRQVDVALPPKRIRFPRPTPTVLVALVLGLLAGAVAAVVRAAASSRVRTRADAERAARVAALGDGAGGPLLVGAAARAGTLQVVPAGPAAAADARVVAGYLAEQARDLGRPTALVDVGDLALGDGAAGGAERQVRAAESGHDAVVVTGPGLNDRRVAAVLDPSRPVVLVARAGRTTRSELGDAAATLARLAVPCVGVVLTGERGGGREAVRVTRGDGGRPARANGTRPDLAVGAGNGASHHHDA